MRRDCPQCGRRPSPCTPLRGHPIRCINGCQPDGARDFVLVQPADAVMSDYLLRRSGTGSAPRVDIAQKPASTARSVRKQLPAPKPDHPCCGVSGFVIRAQPSG